MLAETRYRRFLPNAHCATICAHGAGVLLACYRGPECHNHQCVNIKYFEQNKCLSHIMLPEKTGNCVLIPASDGEAVLIFSYFTDTDGVAVPSQSVQRWMFCTNWKVRVRYDAEVGELVLGQATLLEIKPLVGLLTRCAPIRVEDTWHLPLYREHDCYGLIATSVNGWDWKEQGKIGAESNKISGRFGSGILIQPTIWYDGVFHALCRDVSRVGKAWYSTSPNCKDWSNPVLSKVDNANNSIVAIQNRIWIQEGFNTPLMVWNEGMDRSCLTLGRWDPNLRANEAIVKLNLSFSASYPNYCFDKDKILHIVHTDGGVIAHHTLDQEAIEKLESEPHPGSFEKIKWWKQ